MSSFLSEPVDSLPFGSPEKSRRYDADRYPGAVGLNWYRCDPVLRSHLRRHLGEEGLAWAEPHLSEVGELMGGVIAERAEETDRQPPRLDRYDRWGHEIDRIVMPATFEASKQDLVSASFDRPAFAAQAREAGVKLRPMQTAWSYLLNQAEIGMACALGTGTDMVEQSVERYAPDDVKARVRELAADGSLIGETAQMFTERTGGSDLPAIETTATPVGDAWHLNGFKWFASNANGRAFIVMAKPLGAPDGSKGVATFLVLLERRDGSRNGVRIRRLKDKLGTKAVASAEVEFLDAEAFLLGPDPSGAGDAGSTSGQKAESGLARMMQMTNGARLGIAMMGLGCARRSLVEALCYARSREAFGAALIDQPLMQRKLAELIVDTEAATALVFDGYLNSHLRIGAPLIKLRVARLGITAASDAIEVHGGNGYIEDWPVARILRDAQVNTIWEGPDNILCLDVRRAIEREQAHEPFFERLRTAVSGIDHDPATVTAVSTHIDLTEQAVERWQALDPRTAEARLFPLAQLLADTYAGAVLLEHAGWEAEATGSDRGLLVARLYARNRLTSGDPLDAFDDAAEDLERFKELLDGALLDDRPIDSV